MKELLIIVKTPDDGNPLNMPTAKIGYDKYMTVGFKFRHTDGEDYGDYICLPIDETSEGDILDAIQMMARTAYQTERGLAYRGNVQ